MNEMLRIEGRRRQHARVPEMARYAIPGETIWRQLLVPWRNETQANGDAEGPEQLIRNKTVIASGTCFEATINFVYRFS